MTTQTLQSAPEAASPGPIRRWIIDHDDSWVFLIGYVCLTIVLTIWVSLFWLVFMVGLHFVFEYVKKQYDGANGVARGLAWTVWDVKLDLLLVVIAFVLLVYTEVSFGVAGLASAGRAGVIGARLGHLTRAARLPMSFKDLILASRIAGVRKIDRKEITKRREKYAADTPDAPAEKARALRIASAKYPWQNRWRLVDKIAIVFIVVNLAAFFVAFAIAQETPAEILAIVAHELHPWPTAVQPPDGA